MIDALVIIAYGLFMLACGWQMKAASQKAISGGDRP